MYHNTCIQVEPYLYSNGSGYVPDLLRLMAETYKRLHHGDGDILPYEIHHVSTWDQLQHAAKSSHWVGSF